MFKKRLTPNEKRYLQAKSGRQLALESIRGWLVVFVFIFSLWAGATITSYLIIIDETKMLRQQLTSLSPIVKTSFLSDESR